MSTPASHISAEQMKTVLDVARMLTVTTDLDLLLAHIAEAATGLLNCERASIFFHDPEADELWTKVALQSGEIRVPSGAGIVGHAFKTNKPLHVSSPYEDPRFNREPDRKSGFITRNLLCAPMMNFDRSPVGVIQAINKRDSDFTDSDQVMIELLADQAGVAFQRHRLQMEAVEAVALRREMDLARRVQEAMLPKTSPTIPNLNAVGWAKPASTTGGDAYDFWKLPSGRLGIFLADASGHGMAPTLVVSQTRTLVRALAELDEDPHRILFRVNARLTEDLEAERFVTAFVGFLSSDGTLQWSCAGHGPIFLRRSLGAELESLEAPGVPLGVIPDWPGDAPSTIKFQRGGEILLMSDGIFEAQSPVNEQIGVERIIEIINLHRTSSPQDLIRALRAATRAWQGRDEPVDDQTVVVVRVTS